MYDMIKANNDATVFSKRTEHTALKYLMLPLSLQGGVTSLIWCKRLCTASRQLSLEPWFALEKER